MASAVSGIVGSVASGQWQWLVVGGRWSVSGYSEDFHYFVAEVVDDFDGDAAGGGFFEWARGVAVQRCPGVGVDLGFERGLERLVGIVGAEEVGVAHEKVFLVVVGVDEPTGDPFRPVAAHFARVGVKYIYAVDSDL